jgi:hypothetical protein
MGIPQTTMVTKVTTAGKATTITDSNSKQGSLNITYMGIPSPSFLVEKHI